MGDYTGDLIDAGQAYDADARYLAEQLGGQAQVRFENDPYAREFDAVSDDWIGEAKPGITNGSKFCAQAKMKFKVAEATGRGVYYCFSSAPGLGVEQALSRDTRDNMASPWEYR